VLPQLEGSHPPQQQLMGDLQEQCLSLLLLLVVLVARLLPLLLRGG
jgi:hypothetical protein